MSTSVAADPASEIRITALHATRGLNFWSKRPVIRMDLAVGAFDEISSNAPTARSIRMTGRFDQKFSPRVAWSAVMRISLAGSAATDALMP